MSAWRERSEDRLKPETYHAFSLEARWKVLAFFHSSYPNHGPHPSAALRL